MKIFDCFMFYDEEMLLDIRLNILDEYVDQFIIVESDYTHSGKKRDFLFDIKKFKKFEHKINYLALKGSPKDIEEINSYDTDETKESKIILNGYRRDNFQRENISSLLKSADPNDQIIISDLDEIPKLENINFKVINNKIILFNQKMFYYKLNLVHETINWFGSKSCKMKDLISPQWLRNIKDRKYPLWRIDTLFSKKKYNDIHIVNDGGWHFTKIKTPEEIHKTLKSYTHHLEFEQSNIGVEDIKKMVNEKKPYYDLTVDQTKDKTKSSVKLKTANLNELPIYIQKNQEKFGNWIVKN